jgi:hypothetical protein
MPTTGGATMSLWTQPVGAFGIPLYTEETPIPNAQMSFPYSVNPAVASSVTANGGTITQASGKAVLQTSANVAGSAILSSLAAARYTPGQGQACKFTAIFSPGVAGSRQEIGIGNASDGFFFGYQGETFGIILRRGGVDTLIPQTAWNGEVPVGFTPLVNAQVYTIRYQWLGFGASYYYVEQPSSGRSWLVHTIQYAGTSSIPSVLNPSLPLWARVVNVGNAGNLTLQTASMGAYCEGPLNQYGPRFATGNRKSAITAETSIVTLRNDLTVFGGPANNNRTRVRIDFVSSALAGAADGQLRGLLNATLGGVPAFAQLSAAESVCSVDVAGTTVTGGREVFRIPSSGNAQQYQDISSMNLRLNPGDILTVAGSSFGAGIACNAGLAWVEES